VLVQKGPLSYYINILARERMDWAFFYCIGGKRFVDMVYQKMGS